MASCELCGGEGFYTDAKCETRRCAHRGAQVEVVGVTEGKDGTQAAVYRGMACPQRTCTCPAGKAYARAVRRKVAHEGRLGA